MTTDTTAEPKQTAQSRLLAARFSTAYHDLILTLAEGRAARAGRAAVAEDDIANSVGEAAGMILTIAMKTAKDRQPA